MKTEFVTDTMLGISEMDIPGHIPTPPSDLGASLQIEVANRPEEAKLIVVRDQATLDAVSQRLLVNKALQKEADYVFDEAIAAALQSHRKALAAKRKVTDPLTLEETILKSALQVYLTEQRRIAEEAARAERIAREAEERRLLIEAEEARRAEEIRVNAELKRQHEEEVERALEAMPAETPAEVIEQICNTPEPEHVYVPMDIPVLPAASVAVVPTVVVPKGISMSRKYKAEVTSITALCRAVAEGKVPSVYVTPNQSALNKRVSADGASASIPGVRVVEDFTMRSGSR